MEELPVEIIEAIASLLAPTAVLRLRRVSRRLHASASGLYHSPTFTHENLLRSRHHRNKNKIYISCIRIPVRALHLVPLPFLATIIAHESPDVLRDHILRASWGAETFPHLDGERHDHLVDAIVFAMRRWGGRLSSNVKSVAYRIAPVCVARGHRGCLERLCKRTDDEDCDYFARDVGRVSLIEAARCGRLDILQFLLDTLRVAPCIDAAMAACYRGHVQILCTLAPLVDVTADENWCLREAARKGHERVVSLLLTNAAVDPSACGNKSLISASENGHVGVVAHLLRHPSVDPAARDNEPLVAAASRGHDRVVALLLDREEVDPCARGNLALRMLTLRGASERIIRRLCDLCGDEGEDSGK